MEKQETKKFTAGLIGIMIVVLSILTIIPVPALAETESGDYRYELLEGNSIEITGYIGSDASIVIPSTIDGYTVKKIGNNAFNNCTSITSVKIPGIVEYISPMSFLYCYNLQEFVVDGNNQKYYSNEGVLYLREGDAISLIKYPPAKPVTQYTIQHGTSYIERFAFRDSTLESIILTDDVSTIGTGAFMNCKTLSSITMPKNLVSLGTHMFFGCESLAFITIPDGVTEIGSNTFSGCGNLTAITIPKSVTSIGDQAFSGCNNLSKIYYNGTPEEWNQISIVGNDNTALKFNNIIFTAVSGVSLAKNNITIKSGESETLVVTVTPDTAVNKHLTWSSDNESAATVEDGTVNGISKGTAIITVTTDDGDYSATCNVTVECAHKNTTIVNEEPSACNKHGHTGYTLCNDCNEIIEGKNQELPFAKHSFGEWVTIKEATSTQKGIKERTCSICNYKESEDIPVIGAENNDSNKDNNPENSDKSSDTAAKNPKTGYESNMLIYIILSAVSGTILILISIWLKKHKNHSRNE